MKLRRVIIYVCSHTCVALRIIEKLLAESEQRHLQLISDSYLDMLHAMLDSSHGKMRMMAATSVSPLIKFFSAFVTDLQFVAFAEREEGNTPYHRQYDSFIHHFASLSLCGQDDPVTYKE